MTQLMNRLDHRASFDLEVRLATEMALRPIPIGIHQNNVNHLTQVEPEFCVSCQDQPEVRFILLPQFNYNNADEITYYIPPLGRVLSFSGL